MKKRIFTLKNIFLSILICFIILHITPQLSIRTHLLVTGHPKTAFTTQITKVNRDTDSKNISFYDLTEPPTIRSLDIDLKTYKVIKILFLYFSVYNGKG